MRKGGQDALSVALSIENRLNPESFVTVSFTLVTCLCLRDCSQFELANSELAYPFQINRRLETFLQKPDSSYALLYLAVISFHFY